MLNYKDFKPIKWSRVYEILRFYYLKTLSIYDLIELTDNIKYQQKISELQEEKLTEFDRKIHYLNCVILSHLPRNDYY